MKRSKIIIALASLLACVAMFIACGPVANEVIIKEEPTNEIIKYAQQTFEPETNKSLNSVFEKAFSNGSVNLIFKNEDLFDLDASVYTSANDKKFALLTDMDIGNGNVDFGLYANDKEIVVASRELFGETAYGVSLENILGEFKASSLYDDLKVKLGDDFAEFEEMLNQLEVYVSDAYDKREENDAEVKAINAKHFKVLKNKLDDCVAGVDKESVTTNGKKVDAIVVKYNFDTKAIDDIVNICIEWCKELGTKLEADEFKSLLVVNSAETEGDADDDAELDLTEYFTDVDLDISVALNRKSGAIMLVTVDFDILGPAPEGLLDMEAILSPEEYKGSIILDFGENPKKSEKYVFTFTDLSLDEPATVTLALHRTDNNDLYSRKLVITTPDGVPVTIDFSHRKLHNEYVITISTEDAEIFRLGGYLGYNDDEFKLTVNALSVMGEDALNATEFEVEAKAADEVPPMPEYTNIFTLTVEELGEILGDIIPVPDYSVAPMPDDIFYGNYE